MLKSPNFHAPGHFLLRVGKFPGTVSLRLCEAKAECRGVEGEFEKERERSRTEEKKEERVKRNQELDKKKRVIRRGHGCVWSEL